MPSGGAGTRVAAGSLAQEDGSADAVAAKGATVKEEVEEQCELKSRRDGAASGGRGAWPRARRRAAALALLAGAGLAALAVGLAVGLSLALNAGGAGAQQLGSSGPQGTQASYGIVRYHRLPSEPLVACNDGTSPVISYSPGTEEGYVVMLDGGGQCSSLACLLRREPRLRSTAADVDGAAARAPGGVLSRRPQATPVANWSLVTVRYCSSDGWHGDVSGAFSAAEMDAAGVPAEKRYQFQHFRGARIVDAVFRLLTAPARGRERRALGLPRLSSDTPILFGGFSAGARGAMVHGDGVRTRFNLSRIALWLDSGYYVDMGSGSSLHDQTREIFTRYVNGSLAARWSDVARWQDLFGVYRMPSIATRFVAIMSQNDSFQANAQYDGVTDQAVMKSRVAAAIKRGLTELDPLPACATIVSDLDATHAVTANDGAFASIGAPQVSLARELGRVVDPACRSLTRFIRDAVAS
jgi:hypothetical protein